MKRIAALAALICLMLTAGYVRAEGWIVDESLEDDAEGASEVVRTISDPYELNLSFVGDCSIGGLPASRGRPGTYTAVVDEKGPAWPFSLVRYYLDNDDLTFANSEVVFTNATRYQSKRTVLGAPPEYAKVYLHSGIDILNTANNHCMDYYAQGYRDTLQTLDALGIPHFGTLYPGTKQEQDRLETVEIKGVRIGAVGFSYPQTADLPLIGERIKKLRGAGCDLVIVSLHWGREVSSSPKGWQITMAQRVIELGADVIWGHHPHILQQVMFCQGKPVFFSTGNFTFGAMQDVDPDTGIFQLKYSLRSGKPELVRFSVVPCRTQGKGDFRPMPLTQEKEKQKMLKKLIYTKPADGMRNLPADFAKTGVIDLVNGDLP